VYVTISVVSVCITGFQSYSPKIPIFCPTPAESGATPAESGAIPAESGATPAESGATPAESGDSVRNQWGTEKYCLKAMNQGFQTSQECPTVARNEYRMQGVHFTFPMHQV